jgi:hypothetical protein
LIVGDIHLPVKAGKIWWVGMISGYFSWLWAQRRLGLCRNMGDYTWKTEKKNEIIMG